MMRILLLAVVPLASADTGNAQSWSSQVDTDKANINSKIKSLEQSVKGFMLMEQDDAKIKGFAHKAQSAANDVYQTRISDAKNTYHTAVSYLDSLPAGANKTGAMEKVVRTKDRLDDLQEEERNYASQKLHEMRQAQKDTVLNLMGETKGQVKQMKKDRNHLENARANEGWGEQRFEKEEMNNERWAEDSQLYAEKQKDNATDTVERIFGRAERYLEGAMETRTEREAEAEQQLFANQDSGGMIPLAFAPIGFLLASFGFVRLASVWKRPTPIVSPLLG